MLTLFILAKYLCHNEETIAYKWKIEKKDVNNVAIYVSIYDSFLICKAFGLIDGILYEITWW